MKRSAVIDETRTYRYQLDREWDAARAKVAFVMLNPSTADEQTDDPTIRRCIRFACSWGFGSLRVDDRDRDEWARAFVRAYADLWQRERLAGEGRSDGTGGTAGVADTEPGAAVAAAGAGMGEPPAGLAAAAEPENALLSRVVTLARTTGWLVYHQRPPCRGWRR